MPEKAPTTLDLGSHDMPSKKTNTTKKAPNLVFWVASLLLCLMLFAPPVGFSGQDSSKTKLHNSKPKNERRIPTSKGNSKKRHFTPSERIDADKAVPFPVDI